MFDAAIVGAGPAGATLARLLGATLKVALLEKRSMSDDPSGANDGPLGADGGKCCGGLLAPDAQRALARLRLGLPHRLLADPQLFAVRAVDCATGHSRMYQRHYVNIDRALFDRWLWSLLPDRVVVLDQCLAIGVAAGPRGSIIRYRKAGREYSLEARLVLGTGGAGTPVPGLLDEITGRFRRYLALQEWFECPESPPYYQALFDPSLTDYYAWTIPKNGALIVGAALSPGRDANARFERLKAGLIRAGLPLRRRLRRECAFLLRPRWTDAARLPDLASGNRALAGEAGGLVSPSSGEGLSYALESASLLAASIRDAGEPGFARLYRRALRGLQRKIFWKCLKNPFIYAGLPRRLVMAVGWGALGGAPAAAAVEHPERRPPAAACAHQPAALR